MQAQGVDGGLVAGLVVAARRVLRGRALGELVAHGLKLLFDAVFTAQAQHGIPGFLGVFRYKAPAFVNVAELLFQRFRACLCLGQRGFRGHGACLGGATLSLQRLHLLVDREGQKAGLLVELDGCGQGVFGQGGKLLGGFFRGGAAGALQFNGGQRDAFQRAGSNVAIGCQAGQHFGSPALRAGHFANALSHLIQRPGRGARSVAAQREGLDVGVHLTRAHEGSGAHRSECSAGQRERVDERAQVAGNALDGLADAAVGILDLAALLDEHHPGRHAAGQAGDHIGHLHGKLAVGLAQQVGFHAGVAGLLGVLRHGLADVANAGRAATKLLEGIGHAHGLRVHPAHGLLDLGKLRLHGLSAREADLDADVAAAHARTALPGAPFLGLALAAPLRKGFVLQDLQLGQHFGHPGALHQAAHADEAFHAGVVQARGAVEAHAPLCAAGMEDGKRLLVLGPEEEHLLPAR